MTTETPTQPGGETNTSVENAAERILGLLDAQEPPKTQETQPSEAPEPTPADGQQETEAKVEEGTSAKEDDAQNVEFETVDQLAEAMGLPLETLLNLKARANVDGKEDTVPISEILKSYQLSKHVNNQSQELANQRKAFEAERESRFNELTQRLNEAAALSQHLEQSLMAEYNRIDWTSLRQTNPAEFAATKQDYNERWNQIQAMKQKVAFEAQRIQQEQESKAKEEQTKYLSSQKALLSDLIPDWRDSKKADVERAELRSFLKSSQFTDEEIGGIADARVVKLIRNAMLYEKSTQKAAIAQKKVVTLPKVLKPGNQTKDTKGEKAQEYIAVAKRSGKLSDAAAAIERMMK